MKQFLKICMLLLLVNSAAEAQFRRYPDGWYYTEADLFGPVTPVKSVAGKTGVITLTAGDIKTNSLQQFVSQADIDRWNSYSSVTGVTPGLGSDAVHAITDPLSESVANATYALGLKVDKVLGKDLSTNDFSNAYKNKLDGLFVPTLSNLGGVDLAGVHAVTDPLAQAITTQGNTITLKVDKVPGKDLSSNDFSNTYKNKLDGLSNQSGLDATGVNTLVGPQLATKVDKVTGKDLSTNDYTTTEKTKLAGLAIPNAVSAFTNDAGYQKASDVNTAIAGKVDKVTGKDLSTNDYTTAEKTKLTNTPSNIPGLLGAKADTNNIKSYQFGADFAGALTSADKGRLSNTGVTAGTYGDATHTPVITVDAKGRISAASQVTSSGSGSVSQVASDWNQTNTTSADFIKNKPTGVSAFTNDAGYQKAADVNTAIAGKVDKVTGKDLSTNDYTTAEKTKLAGLSTPTLAGLGGVTSAQAQTIARQAIADSMLTVNGTNGITATKTGGVLNISYTGPASTSATVDQTYLASSANAQSGVAVNQGLTALGNTKAPLSHSHVPGDINGMQAYVNGLIDNYMTAIPGYTSTGDIVLSKHNGSNLWIATPTSTTTSSTTQLAAPTSLSLTATSATNVAASWSASPNATGYILQRASSNTFADATTSYSGANTSAPGSNTLTASTTYYYRVQATTTTTGYTSSGFTIASVTTPAASTTATTPTSTTGLLASNPFTNWNLAANTSNAAGITNTNSVTATADSYIVGNPRSVSGATESIIQMDCVDGVGTGDLAFGKGTGWASGNAFTVSISHSNSNKIFVRSGTAYLQQPVVTGVTSLRLRKVPRTDGTAGDRIYAEYWKGGAWVTLDSSVITTVDEYPKGALSATVGLTNVQATGLTN